MWEEANENDELSPNKQLNFNLVSYRNCPSCSTTFGEFTDRRRLAWRATAGQLASGHTIFAFFIQAICRNIQQFVQPFPVFAGALQDFTLKSPPKRSRCLNLRFTS